MLERVAPAATTVELGAAMRGFVEGLPPEALDRVRKRFQDGLLEAGIDTLDASSLIAVGQVP